MYLRDELKSIPSGNYKTVPEIIAQPHYNQWLGVACKAPDYIQELFIEWCRNSSDYITKCKSHNPLVWHAWGMLNSLTDISYSYKNPDIDKWQWQSSLNIVINKQKQYMDELLKWDNYVNGLISVF